MKRKKPTINDELEQLEDKVETVDKRSHDEFMLVNNLVTEKLEALHSKLDGHITDEDKTWISINSKLDNYNSKLDNIQATIDNVAVNGGTFPLKDAIKH